MDLGLEGVLASSSDGVRDDDDNINISDVIEVIQTTDPDFKQSGMFSGGGEISTVPGQAAVTGQRVNGGTTRRQSYVKILEQPASKALRFRYECEGRSAGSIPGASSTPENKTFPAIQVVGYQGRAVVVVSCVTKDPPYRPHPHNLVGREGCRRGVCTLEVSPETMAVTFSNLGIQCVKKKDIEDALKVREEIRVDPFRTGFAHRNQPTSIDLNAVRLCFQVFLEGDNRGKFTVPLSPVVSDPIYDKKAMSDLVICKLSDCTCTVAGGKEIILLCEKVAKEDIQVRFYEESNGAVMWEALGDFQPTHVHKQVAISFRTPRYRTLEVSDPVKVFIQLRRPSDGATSESLPFELLPLDSGRPAFWSLRRALHKKGDYNTFNSILAADRLQLNKNAPTIRQKSVKIQNGSAPLLFQSENTIDEVEIIEPPAKTKPVLETNLDEVEITVVDEWKQNDLSKVTSKPKDWCDYAEVEKISVNPKDIQNIQNIQNNNNIEEKSLNDLLNQVAELDEIYSDTQARLLTINDQINDAIESEPLQIQPMEVEAFDDSNTYSSLQLAFKNPIEIELPNDVITAHGPVIEIAPLKRESDPEKLPPLPPKRIRKSIETPILDRAVSQTLGSNHSILLTGSQAESLFHTSSPNLVATPVSRASSFNNITRPKSQELLAPSKKLPPTPCSTLPNPKKQSFLSKLFSKKPKKDKTSPNKANSTTNLNTRQTSLKTGSASLGGGSLCNISDSNNDGSIIHISLHPTPTGSLNDVNKLQNNQNLANKLNGNVKDDEVINLDLTEAEHYALYTAMAPHATQNPVILKRKRQKFGNDPNSHVLRHLHEQEKARHLHSQLNMFNIPAETSVKIEPRDTSPSPYGGQMYGGSGLSPVYNPQGGASPQPQYIFPVENLPGRTPSPLDPPTYAFPPSNFPNITPPPMNIQAAQQSAAASMVGTTILAAGNVQMSHMSVGLSNYMIAQQNWNVANVTDDPAGPFNTAAEASNAMNVVDSAGAGLSSVLDLDSQELTQLDSAELAGLNLFDASLSENLTNNLSLSDIKTDTHHKEDMAQENMTDSFTRLTTATIDNICNLNNMYKPNIKE